MFTRGGGSSNLVVTPTREQVGQSVTKQIHTDNGVFYFSNVPYDNSLGTLIISNGAVTDTSNLYVTYTYNSDVLSFSYSSSGIWYRAAYNDLG